MDKHESQKWRRRVATGAATASVGLGGMFGLSSLMKQQDTIHAGAAGDVISLDEQNGMLRTDGGKAAFLNLLKEVEPGKLGVRVSISTDPAQFSQMKRLFAESNMPMDVDEGNFVGLGSESNQIIRDFFSEFEALTGVQVEVVENDASADVLIGSYSGDHDYIGYASFPKPPQTFSPNQSYMILSDGFIQERLSEGNPEAVEGLVAHEFGHNIGLQHTHDDDVETAMSEPQQNAASRMAYSNYTIPGIAESDIDTGYGAMDIYTIRKALKEAGYGVPSINPESNYYDLEKLAEEQAMETQPKFGGSLSRFPAISITDNGGHNSLQGTSGDDLLVTESGYCGQLHRESDVLELSHKDQPYCLVEGEFSVVRSGDGHDLILTANGTEQIVHTGTGTDEVAVLHEEVGNKAIVTDDNSTESDTILTLHYSLLQRGFAVAEQEGDNMVLAFEAPSGRATGKITLIDQQTTEGGIDAFHVIDDEGNVLSEYAVTGPLSEAEWQEQVLNPAEDAVHKLSQEELSVHLDQAMQSTAQKAVARGRMLAQESRAEQLSLADKGGDRSR